MTDREGLQVLHAWWCRERETDKDDRTLREFLVVQEALLRVGWLLINEDREVESCPMTSIGVPQGTA